jgi:hypothetical protein
MWGLLPEHKNLFGTQLCGRFVVDVPEGLREFHLVLNRPPHRPIVCLLIVFYHRLRNFFSMSTWREEAMLLQIGFNPNRKGAQAAGTILERGSW